MTTIDINEALRRWAYNVMGEWNQMMSRPTPYLENGVTAYFKNLMLAGEMMVSMIEGRPSHDAQVVTFDDGPDRPKVDPAHNTGVESEGPSLPESAGGPSHRGGPPVAPGEGGLILPTGTQLEEARGALRRFGLAEDDELLALWFDGWCFGYTTGAHDKFG